MGTSSKIIIRRERRLLAATRAIEISAGPHTIKLSNGEEKTINIDSSEVKVFAWSNAWNMGSEPVIIRNLQPGQTVRLTCSYEGNGWDRKLVLLPVTTSADDQTGEKSDEAPSFTVQLPVQYTQDKPAGMRAGNLVLDEANGNIQLNAISASLPGFTIPVARLTASEIVMVDSGGPEQFGNDVLQTLISKLFPFFMMLAGGTVGLLGRKPYTPSPAIKLTWSDGPSTQTMFLRGEAEYKARDTTVDRTHKLASQIARFLDQQKTGVSLNANRDATWRPSHPTGLTWLLSFVWALVILYPIYLLILT